MPWTLGPPIVLIPLTIKRGGLYYPGFKREGQEHVADDSGLNVKVKGDGDGESNELRGLPESQDSVDESARIQTAVAS
jgi:hypothetical protein